MSISLIKKVHSLGIHLFCLPHNTTHILQPLHISVFGPMKQQWHTVLKQHKITTRASNITKEYFPCPNQAAVGASYQTEYLQAGFRAAGLMPFNLEMVKPAQLALSHAASPSVVPTSEVTSMLTIHVGKTQICAELHGYCHEVLKCTRRRRIEVCCGGEGLTSDKAVERKEKEDAQKAAKKAAKSSKSKKQVYSKSWTEAGQRCTL